MAVETPLPSASAALPPAGETLDVSLQLFRRSLPACLPWSILGVLSGQLATAWDLAQHGTATLAGTKDPQWWLLAVGSGVLNLLLWALILQRQAALLEGHPSDWGRNLLRLLRRLPALLGLACAALALVAVGLALLVLPGAYLSVALLFAFPAFVLEGRGAWSAIDRALRLVRGRWWYTTAIVSVGFLAILVVLALGIVLGVLSGGLVTGGNFEFALVVASIVTTVLAALVAPFLLALCAVQFAQLRRTAGD